MQAAFIRQTGPADVIQFGAFPDPRPSPGQVLVRMRAAGLNPVDCYARAGLLPGELPMPWIPGCDIAGEVVQVGSTVRDFQPGDRVWATNQSFGGRMGTFAELCAVDQEWLYKIPDSVSFDYAAAAALVGVTAHLGLVHRANLQPGQTVFVRGGGGSVGSMVIQMATATGARVIASAGSDEKVTLCLELGAVAAVNYKSSDVPAAIARFAPAGVDVVWDTTRQPDFVQLVGAMGERGQIVLMAGREAQPPFPVGPFYVKQGTMHGIIMLKMSPEEMRRSAADINGWLDNGAIRPQIAMRLPLSDAAHAHQLQERATLQLDGNLSGKILLHPDGY